MSKEPEGLLTQGQANGPLEKQASGSELRRLRLAISSPGVEWGRVRVKGGKCKSISKVFQMEQTEMVQRVQFSSIVGDYIQHVQAGSCLRVSQWHPTCHPEWLRGRSFSRWSVCYTRYAVLTNSSATTETIFRIPNFQIMNLLRN